MDGRRSKGAQGSTARHASGQSSGTRNAGLWVVQRNGLWHIHGTLQTRNGAERIRESLGLPRGTPKRVAEQKAQALQAEYIQRAIHGDEAIYTFADAVQRYLDQRGLGKPKDWIDPEARFVGPLLRYFKTTPLAKLTTDDLRRYLERHCSHLQASSMRRVCATMGGIINGARAAGKIKLVPAIPRPRLPQRLVDKWLFPREVALLLDCFPSWFRTQAFFLFAQGRRPGESVKLRCEHLDLTPGRESYFLPTTKTGQPLKKPLRTETAELLRLLRAARTTQGHAWEGPVFWNSRGRPWADPQGRHGAGLDKVWKGGCVKAAAIVCRLARLRRSQGQADVAAELELRAEKVLGCTPHWGRHTFASHATAQGVDAKVLQGIVGWQSRASLDGYQHLHDTVLREALAGISVEGYATAGKDLRTPSAGLRHKNPAHVPARTAKTKRRQ